MKIKIFPSDKGDCLLISSIAGKNILIDGGMTSSFETHVSPELGKMRAAGQKLDLVCVSHIDDDHILGILKMIEDEVDWRVFDFQSKNGNSNVKKPKTARPPLIKGIWHNAFNEVVKKDTAEIEDMLATQANILSASSNAMIREVGDFALGVKSAIQLSQRLKPGQLNIPLNKEHGGKLVMARKAQKPFKFGTLSLEVFAPFAPDLEKLKEKWDEWVEANKKRIKDLKITVEKDKGSLSTSTSPAIALATALAVQLEPLLLAELQELKTKPLGNRKGVTPPNLASIMFLVRDGKKTALMTGDGHADDIIKGLVQTGNLDPQKGLHLDVIKVQHHGAADNMTVAFCHTLTADTYIFCGNGAHENPELDVIKAIIDSRTTKPAITAQAKKNFILLFNSSSAVTSGKNKAHMQKVEKLVKDRAKKFANIKSVFLSPSNKFLTVKL